MMKGKWESDPSQENRDRRQMGNGKRPDTTINPANNLFMKNKGRGMKEGGPDNESLNRNRPQNL